MLTSAAGGFISFRAEAVLLDGEMWEKEHMSRSGRRSKTWLCSSGHDVLASPRPSPSATGEYIIKASDAHPSACFRFRYASDCKT